MPNVVFLFFYSSFQRSNVVLQLREIRLKQRLHFFIFRRYPGLDSIF